MKTFMSLCSNVPSRSKRIARIKGGLQEVGSQEIRDQEIRESGNEGIREPLIT
jgi:hypothetical protein